MISDSVPSPSSVTPPLSELEVLSSSAFMTQKSGYGLYSGLPDPCTFNGLVSEASELFPKASRQESWDPDVSEGRGGRPRRSLFTSTAGPIQDAWYGSSHLRRFLSSLFELPVIPTGNRGSYSYYARRGDFLDIHRDIDTCDVTVVTTLQDNSAPSDHAGALVLYPGRIGEPLSEIRARPQEGACFIKLMPGQTIVFAGGLIPHWVLPVVDGQVRIISALCFRVLVPNGPSGNMAASFL